MQTVFNPFTGNLEYIYNRGVLIGALNAFNNADFVFTSINTATPIPFNINTLTLGTGLSHSTSTNPSRINILKKGVLQILVNNQVFKGAGVGEVIYFWFRKNGVDVPNSGYAMQVSNGENDIFIVNGTFEVQPGDYIEQYASVTSTLIKLDATPATPPVPLIPSTIVDCLLWTPFN